MPTFTLLLSNRKFSVLDRGVFPMARKRTKQEAQDRIPEFVVPRIARRIPAVRIPAAVLKAAELGARALVEADPLNRLADDVPMTREPREIGRTSVQALADVVNDPAITVTKEMMEVINDPGVVMADNGEVLTRTSRGNDFAGQFRRDLILPRSTKRKKSRKKNPKLARAFKEANARYRTKSGKLRKGRTQGDIARLAHRLMKKM